MKMSKLGTKKHLFGCFQVRIFLKKCHIWNQHPRIGPVAKFLEIVKMARFSAKNRYLGIFELGVLKTIVIFEIKCLRVTEIVQEIKFEGV